MEMFSEEISTAQFCARHSIVASKHVERDTWPENCETETEANFN